MPAPADLLTDPIESAELLAFLACVDAGSISQAAVETGHPRASLTRRLDRLEERLGVRLLRRTTRSLAMTGAGEALYPRARQALEALREAGAALRADGPLMGTIRLSVPPMQDDRLRHLFSAFLSAHPRVRLEIHSGTQMVDLHAGRFDLALRAGSGFDPGLIARPLLRTRLLAVASPAYLDRHGDPATPDDLRRHACLTGYARGEIPTQRWPLRDGGSVRVDGPLTTNDILMLRLAATEGRGIALMPEQMVRADLAADRLRPVLPDLVGTDTQLALIYPDRRFQPPAVRALIAAIQSWASAPESVTG